MFECLSQKCKQKEPQISSCPPLKNLQPNHKRLSMVFQYAKVCYEEDSNLMFWMEWGGLNLQLSLIGLEENFNRKNSKTKGQHTEGCYRIPCLWWSVRARLTSGPKRLYTALVSQTNTHQHLHFCGTKCLCSFKSQVFSGVWLFFNLTHAHVRNRTRWAWKELWRWSGPIPLLKQRYLV